MQKFIYSTTLNLFNAEVKGSITDFLLLKGCAYPVRFRKIASTGKFIGYRVDGSGVTFEIRYEMD